MEKYYLLYNPFARSGYVDLEAKYLDVCNHLCNTEMIDVTSVNDYTEFIGKINKEDGIVVCGGDGTLNNFINHIDGIRVDNKVFYYPLGTGNDFYRDITGSREGHIIEITDLIKNLPTVAVKNNKYKFINGVGYGIDGYCCAVGDELREKNKKKINYASIAVKGLLFHYKPTSATVIVDGKEYCFDNVWIAPTMKGKCYGGGMIPTPDQNRNGHELSVMIFHGKSKLRTLTIFPSIFKGEHVKHEKYVSIFKGKNITVKFNEPRPLQVDGETILDVLEYTAKI